MSFIDFILDIWDWMLDVSEILMDFFSNIDDLFSNLLEVGDTPLLNIWFWLLWITLMLAVWFLPSALKMPDYKLWEKLMYSVIFFGIDYFIIQRFMD
jgi:hypothetical protein